MTRLIGLGFLVLAIYSLVGCVGRETRASREFLNCVYDARYVVHDEKLVNKCEASYGMRAGPR